MTWMWMKVYRMWFLNIFPQRHRDSHKWHLCRNNSKACFFLGFLFGYVHWLQHHEFALSPSESLFKIKIRLQDIFLFHCDMKMFTRNFRPTEKKSGLWKCEKKTGKLKFKSDYVFLVENFKLTEYFSFCVRFNAKCTSW